MDQPTVPQQAQQAAAPPPHVTNVYVTQTVSAPAYAVLPQQKNVALAAILGFCFGPLGMLYVGFTPALIMFVASLAALFLTFGFGLIITIPICAIWAATEANKQNAQFALAVQHPTQYAPPAPPQVFAPQPVAQPVPVVQQQPYEAPPESRLNS